MNPGLGRLVVVDIVERLTVQVLIIPDINWALQRWCFLELGKRN